MSFSATKRKLFPVSPEEENKRKKLCYKNFKNWDIDKVGEFLDYGGFGHHKSKFKGEFLLLRLERQHHSIDGYGSCVCA